MAQAYCNFCHELLFQERCFSCHRQSACRSCRACPNCASCPRCQRQPMPTERCGQSNHARCSGCHFCPICSAALRCDACSSQLTLVPCQRCRQASCQVCSYCSSCIQRSGDAPCDRCGCPLEKAGDCMCGGLRCPNCDHCSGCADRHAIQQENSSAAASASTPTVQSCQQALPSTPRVSLGIATWNINHLGKRTREERLLEKLQAILLMFKNNPWLEVMILQEVNGVEPLRDLEEEGLALLSTGPHLLTQSDETDTEVQRRLESSSGSKDPKPQLKDRYHEYYPILVRHGSPIRLTGIRLLWPTGEIASLDLRNPGTTAYKGVNAELEVNFRPVIVYDLLKDGQAVHVGVVHTSPAGDEFHRMQIFQQQIQGILKLVDHRELWILGGDYYLTREARVMTEQEASVQLQTARRQHGGGSVDEHRNTARLTFEQYLPTGLNLVTPISGTNWKHKTLAQEDTAGVQIADFFIATHPWAYRCAGLMEINPRGGIVVVDPQSWLLAQWIEISDHAPVGAFFSTFDNATCLQVAGYTRETEDTAQKQLEMLENIRQLELEKARKELKQLQILSTARALSGQEQEQARTLQEKIKRLEAQNPRAMFSPQDFDPLTPPHF